MEKIKMDQFEILGKIGVGAFCSVYKVKRKEDNQVYAMKKVSMKFLKERELENALNEIRILSSLNHPYIIGFKESFIDWEAQELCIIMDFADGGDLSLKIKSLVSKKRRFAEEKVLRYSFQLLSALAELHRRNIIHWDMKAANIFICDS